MRPFTPSKISLGRNLKRLRLELGYSQGQWALIFKISDKAVSHWEKGRSEPSATQLLRMAQIGNKPLLYFLQE